MNYRLSPILIYRSWTNFEVNFLMITLDVYFDFDCNAPNVTSFRAEERFLAMLGSH